MNIVIHHRTRGKGAEGAHLRGVAKGLRQLGHNVRVLSMPGADPEQDDSSERQIPREQPADTKPSLARRLVEATKRLPPFVFELFEVAYNALILVRLGRTIRAHSAQMVYERYSLFMVAGIWLCRRKNLPIVLEINDSCMVHRVRPLVFAGLARRMEAWAFRNASGLVFISTRFQDLARESHQDLAPSVVTPNAADLDIFNVETADPASLRAELGVADKVVLGYVGAFVHWHGIDWFMERIAPNLKAHPDLCLLLVGDGVCYETIANTVREAGVSDQVILPGRVPHDKVPDYIAAMDFGILPDSNIYGSPMKLFEFMAMGKAMVVPNFPPIAEVVVDNKTAWLFPAGDREACVQRVLELADQTDVQQAIGQQALDYIRTSRQWVHNAQMIDELVPGIAGAGAP